MRGARRPWCVALLLVLPVPVVAQPAVGKELHPALARLEREVARLAPPVGGTVGAAIAHVESARRIGFNSAERFPMASTYKIPIAIQLLTRVDRGELALDNMVSLRPMDLHPGSGTLTALFNKPGVALSLRNLLELMLLISDNTATDLLLEQAGGAAAVNDRMQQLGIEGIRVDRPTLKLIADWAGLASVPAAEAYSIEALDKAFDAIPETERKAAAARFDTDPRDTATPDAMANLLQKLWRKQALSPLSTELLLDIMRRCQTGEGRLKGLLPPATPVAHKTGSIGGTTNDVGIVTLPDDAGHVIVAAFVRGSDKETAVRERVIAQIARAAYDFFLFARE